jgi:tetratricopeptide (TPR) repeat protein
MDPKLLKSLKARKFLIVIAHLTRTILLLITLISLTTLFFWVYRPDLIGDLEKRIRDNYGKIYMEQNKKAEDLINKKQASEAYSILTKQLEEMGEVKKLDRLKGPYISSLKKLLFLATMFKNKEAALRTTQMLVDLDSNDVQFLIQHSKALAAMGNFEDAESFLQKANKLSPTLPTPVEQLSLHYIKTDRKEKAKGQLEDFLVANRHLHVLLKVFDSQGKKSGNLLSHEKIPVTGKTQALKFKVMDDKGFLFKNSRLQLTFAGEHLLRMKIRGISAETPMGLLRFAPEDLKIGSSGIKKTDTGQFLLKGKNPSITFNVPDKLIYKVIKGLYMEVEFRPAFSPLMERLYGEVQ